VRYYHKTPAIIRAEAYGWKWRPRKKNGGWVAPLHWPLEVKLVRNLAAVLVQINAYHAHLENEKFLAWVNS